jgi:hypothetical protein
MGSMVRRMVGAAKLDAATYEEVEADKGATGQALGVVFLSGLAVTIGDFSTWDIGLLERFLGGILAWMVWVLFIWLAGVKLLPESETRSNVGELIRTTGFAASPGVLRVFAVLPMAGWIVAIVVWLWTLAAMVVAVRQALDYKSTGRAVAVSVIGFCGQLLVTWFEWLILRAAVAA